VPARFIVAASGGLITLLGVAFTFIDSNLFASAVLIVGLAMAAGGTWPEISPKLADAARASVVACHRILWLVSFLLSNKSGQHTRATGSGDHPGEIADGEVSDEDEQVRLKRRQRYIRPSTRFLLLRQAGYRCQICGASQARDRSVELHIDHRIPVAEGGTNEVTNLWVLCKDCNLGKGTKSL